ncbi:hypothetical protein RB195_020862 [Necator americanus]|uniref:7TM GPCR serpentine receptor class x (Srx) domain-containing protein n=1 Tax=Necator americanus TaxID=51031 RepID=A0ABR1CMZ9_NECAM
MCEDFLIQLITVQIVRGVGCITCGLNCLACYIILQHSPRHMQSYKRVLLGITVSGPVAALTVARVHIVGSKRHETRTVAYAAALGSGVVEKVVGIEVGPWRTAEITAAAVDALITLLVVPVPLEGALGNELIGPLAVLAPNWGNLFTLILLWALTSLLWSIEIGFAYRLYVVNSSMNGASAGPLINLILFGHPLVLIAFLSIMYARAFSPEEEKRRYVTDHALQVSPKSALMLILQHKYREHTEFSISFLMS